MMQQIGSEIQRIRMKRGMTQEDLAEKASLNSTHVGHIEQGRREPKFRTLQKIAKALNVRVKDLITF